MSLTGKKYHWLVRNNYLIRAMSFAALFIAIGMHMAGRGYGTVAWGLLGLQFLVYPHLVFWRARHARDSLKAEFSNLTLDTFLLGIWAATLGFPTWIAFTMFMGASLNNATIRGWRGTLDAFLAYFAGALLGVVGTGFRYAPETEPSSIALCMVGLTIYVLNVGNVTFVRNLKLRDTRETLKREELVRKAAQEKLHASEERFRMITDMSSDVFWQYDTQLHITYVSEGERKLRGYAPHETIDKSFQDILTPPSFKYFMEKATRLMDLDRLGTPLRTQSYEVEAYRQDGGTLWLEMSSTPLRDPEGRITGFFGIARDISVRKLHEQALRKANVELEARLAEIQRLQTELHEQAVRDPLTGIYNRRYFDEILEHELARAKRGPSPLCLMMIDLDHFKKVNDTYGHQAGDEILRMFGTMLRESARAGDIPCRYGGEEFLLLMPKITAEAARQRAEHLRAEFAAGVAEVGDHRIQATVSIGIAVYPEHGETPDVLTQAANLALYLAKRGGRNRVAVFTAS